MPVEPEVAIFPNWPDEGYVAFNVWFRHNDSEIPNLEQFEVEISGNIPETDSIQDLRKTAFARAAAILEALAASG